MAALFIFVLPPLQLLRRSQASKIVFQDKGIQDLLDGSLVFFAELINFLKFSQQIKFLFFFFSLVGQAMCLSSIKKPAMGGRYSVLGRTFQGQKHGCKDFGVP
jgi:hypothetical protein